jgi:hypothetical protein
MNIERASTVALHRMYRKWHSPANSWVPYNDSAWNSATNTNTNQPLSLDVRCCKKSR